MLLSALLQGVQATACTAPEDLAVTGLAYDSRRVEPGYAFVAISGFVTDGNQYIPMARERGAAVIVTETAPAGDGPYVVVPSARLALAQMAANWYGRPAEKLTMVGVTGTNGKSSVVMLMQAVLEQVTGEKVGLIGTIENRTGSQVLPSRRTTPESLELQALLARMAAAGCRYVVMEVSSHALALERVGGITFQAAAFTNLTEDHLDFHGTMAAYARAKARLFTRCRAGVFNLDDPWAGEMMAGCTGKVITYSLAGKPADLTARDLTLAADHVAFRVGDLPVRLGIPGRFSAYNALTVLGLAMALDLALPPVAQALAHAQGVRGRIEVVPTPGTGFTVLIDYAHTPDGLENVLRAARGFCRGRLVAVFGCGGDRDRQKRPIMGKIGVDLADFVVFTSDNPRSEAPEAILQDILAGVGQTDTPYVVIPDRREAIGYSLDRAKPGDIVLLAGKGHETYQEVNGVKRHLDEREEVAAWLNRRRKEVT